MIKTLDSRKYPRMNFARSALLFMFIISFYLTNVMNFGGFDMGGGLGGRENGAHFQVHNLIFVFMATYLVFVCRKIGRIIIPSFWLTMGIIYALLLVLFYIPEFGFRSFVINMLYAFAAIVVIYNLYKDFDMDDITNVICIASIFSLVMVIINMLFQVGQIITFVRSGAGGYGHPSVNVLVAGGVNAEATNLAMFSIFLMHKRYGMFMWSLSFFISCIYASRTSFLICILVLFWHLVFVRDILHHISVKTCMLTIIILMAVFYFAVNSQIGEILMYRFAKTGDEGASLHRLSMWRGTLEVLEKYPFGVGTGNTLIAMLKVTGVTESIGNIHNIILQYVSEYGIVVGPMFIICSILWILKHEIKTHFRNPFGVFMLVYFFQGMFQTRGYDVSAACVLGFYFISLKQRRWLPR